MTELITKINSRDQSAIIRLVDIAVLVLMNEHNCKRKGATFHVRNERRHVLFNERFGIGVDVDDSCLFDFFASEKTIRLCDHPDHILSWQSHDMKKKQYPGGVRFALGLVASLSGFTAEEDEATVLWVGVQMGWISGPGAYAAAQISGNSRYIDLMQKFNQAELPAA